MLIFDSHCDTMTELMSRNERFESNSCHISLEQLNPENCYGFFTAAFISPKYKEHALKRAIDIIEFTKTTVKQNNEEIILVKSRKELNDTINKKKNFFIISVEGGEAIEDNIDNVMLLNDLGVRSICLTWNYANNIADGILDSHLGRGLTNFGINVVNKMEELNMIIDLSHISEKGFFDVMKNTEKPFIVSHSNAKKLCNHVRNLTDEQILAVASRNGVIGINLYSNFLKTEGPATISDIINHIEYISSLVGTDYVGFGFDFDGVEQLPYQIDGVKDIYKIIDTLFKLNYKKSEVENICGGNFLRVMNSLLI